jgi:hypothetical protein
MDTVDLAMKRNVRVTEANDVGLRVVSPAFGVLAKVVVRSVDKEILGVAAGITVIRYLGGLRAVRVRGAGALPCLSFAALASPCLMRVGPARSPARMAATTVRPPPIRFRMTNLLPVKQGRGSTILPLARPYCRRRVADYSTNRGSSLSQRNDPGLRSTEKPNHCLYGVWT